MKKSTAIKRYFAYFRKGQKQGKHVVVAGCVSQGAPRQEYIKGLSLIGVQQIDRVVEVVEETLKGKTKNLALYRKKLTTWPFLPPFNFRCLIVFKFLQFLKYGYMQHHTVCCR